MKKDRYYLGIDVGSVSINLILMDEYRDIVKKVYMRTEGKPIKILKRALADLAADIQDKVSIAGVGATGSGRNLASALVGADVVKNEITAHGIAAISCYPEARTIIEIGGQDSKIILIKNGMVSDFAMNTVCAAGTGSFLDRQAARLNIPIDQFGKMALRSRTPVRIAGRCAVFAESDMIHKQQAGCPPEDIVAGLCQALVRNYLNNVGKGKTIVPQVLFQGGVAANAGIRKAFEEALNCSVIVPRYYDVMGALGAAILAQIETGEKACTRFRGFKSAQQDFQVKSFECQNCPNLCEVVEINAEKHIVARWGDRCGKWTVGNDHNRLSSLA